MVHDLLPLDMPEFFRANELGLFERRIATAIHYAKAFITTTQSVRARLAEECRRRNYPAVPIHVQPLPSTLADAGHKPSSAVEENALSDAPYFVVLGSIEARKNHHVLLNI